MGTSIFLSIQLLRLLKTGTPLNQFPSSPRPCTSSGHCMHYKLMASGRPVMFSVWGHWSKTDSVNIGGETLIKLYASCHTVGFSWWLPILIKTHMTIENWCTMIISTTKLFWLIGKIPSRNCAMIFITAFVISILLNLNRSSPIVFFLKISKHVYLVVLYEYLIILKWDELWSISEGDKWL